MVTLDGSEIRRAQAMLAAAPGVEPVATMNVHVANVPVLVVGDMGMNIKNEEARNRRVR